MKDVLNKACGMLTIITASSMAWRNQGDMELHQEAHG